MKKYTILVIIAILILLTCLFYKPLHNMTIENDNSMNNKTNSLSNTLNIDTNKQKWIQDTNGCIHLRTPELADSLIEKYDLLHKSKSDFLSVFGKPNEILKTKEKTYWRYYIESVCENEILIEEADKSWIDFVFIHDTLINYFNGAE